MRPLGLSALGEPALASHPSGRCTRALSRRLLSSQGESELLGTPLPIFLAPRFEPVPRILERDRAASRLSEAILEPSEDRRFRANSCNSTEFRELEDLTRRRRRGHLRAWSVPAVGAKTQAMSGTVWIAGRLWEKVAPAVVPSTLQPQLPSKGALVRTKRRRRLRHSSNSFAPNARRTTLLNLPFAGIVAFNCPGAHQRQGNWEAGPWSRRLRPSASPT